MSYNVNRNVTDAFYRYKMPKLVAKVEGKGNGIKTVIVNMVDIAKALGRPATYPCKFFGCELGAQTQFNFKEDRYIVNGSHDAGKLQNLLDIFIQKFVLCPACENPETQLYPNEKKGTIKQVCKACGSQTQLDMRHKLTTFILKNPPDVDPQQQGTSLTKKKDRSGRSKRSDEKNGHDRSSLRPGSPRADRSDASDNDLNGEGDKDEDEEWMTDVSEAAVKERMRDLTAGVMNLTANVDSEKTASQRLEMFYEFCKAQKAKGQLKPGNVKVIKDIVTEAERLDIKENKGVMVLVEVLLDENILKQVPIYRNLFMHFTHDNAKCQKYLLGAVEKLVELKKDVLLPKISVILKSFYDTDILEEEVLLEWGKKPSKKYVSKETSVEIINKAQPFLKWLEEAEEEESSEEEDVEIEYNDKGITRSLKEQESKKVGPPAPVVAEAPKVAGANSQDGSDDDDEVDIDNL